MDYSPTGSSVRGILQARIWEWVSGDRMVTDPCLPMLFVPSPSRALKWDRFCLCQSPPSCYHLLPLLFLFTILRLLLLRAPKGCFFLVLGLPDYYIQTCMGLLESFLVEAELSPLHAFDFFLLIPSAVLCLSPCCHPAFSASKNTHPLPVTLHKRLGMSHLTLLFLSCLPDELPLQK